MNLARGLAAIGIMTALGLAKVTERTAVQLSAYGVGRATRQVHDLENDTERLRTQVVSLQSPAQLVHVMRNRKLDMVAWSTAGAATVPGPTAARASTTLAAATGSDD